MLLGNSYRVSLVDTSLSKHADMLEEVHYSNDYVIILRSTMIIHTWSSSIRKTVNLSATSGDFESRVQPDP